MSPLRLALVTGRFWPLAADEDRLLADLAEGLMASGAEVTVVTAQGHKSWPTQVVCRGVPVVRLPRSTTRVWGAYRYQRSLAQCLIEQRRQIDLIYVVGMRDEASAIVGATGGTPVVLRSVGLASSGDCQWHKSTHFGSRIAARCRAADAIVAPSQAAAAELRQAGFPAERIEVIYDGAPARPPQTPDSLVRARAELADVHPLLAVPPAAPLVLYSGPIRDNPGLFDLVAAWPHVLQRHPHAKLWLAGDATGADMLWEEIQQASLTDVIILPGVFDQFDDVLPAVNVFVHAAREPTPSVSLLEAMAAGLPIVATQTVFTEELMETGQDALLTPVGDIAALADALLLLLDDSGEARRLAEAAWKKSRGRHTIQQMAEEHLALFRRRLSTRTLALS